MKRRLLFYFLLCLLSVNSRQLYAQNKSNKGKEFWLGYGHNVLFTQDPPVNSQTHLLYLSTEQPAVVTVSVSGTSWSQTVNIPANTVDFSVAIPKSGADDARLTAEGLFNRGIHIVSDVPIVAYSHQYGLFSSAATMLMPVETYGYTYYSLNYTQVSNYVDSYSWFYVVAAEDNTRVLITPSEETEGGWLPGQTYTVNLNKGQIYNVFGKKTGSFSSRDLTGSKLVSVTGADGNCHPVAFFSGSSRNTICNGNGGEVLQQQIFPANAWGTRYVTYHTVNNASGNISTPFLNIYRVAVRNPATVVKRNGVPLSGLVNNFYYEFSSTSGDFIEADQPVLVAQYTVSSNECAGSGSNPMGDPEMIYLSPIEQGVRSAFFYSTRNQAITLNYINIIAPTSALGSLQIDGIPIAPGEYIIHPVNSNYIVAVRRLLGAAAQHAVSCDSAFIATAYGVGITESYGYNVGTYVNNLNAISQIKNVFGNPAVTDSFTCPKTPFRPYIQLAYRATSIHWKLSQAPGLIPNTDSIISNPVPLDSPIINGRKYYRYTLQQDFIFSNAGTFTIPYTYTATDIDACNQTESERLQVVVKPGPKADFIFPSPSCLSDTIRFTGTSVPGTFNITDYTWFFPDNTTSSSVNAVKLFNAPGNYTVRYRILAENGCAGDTSKTVNILESPAAAFSISNNICRTDSVLITDASTVPVGSVTGWQWNFGDGNTSIRTNNSPFYHKYSNPGTYTIWLITTSSSGCKSDTTFVPVTVLPVPVAGFSTSGNVCLGDSIRFTDNSVPVPAESIFSWHWNFGDNSSQIRYDNAPFFHTYTGSGNFNVSLVVTGTNTCASDTFRLTVNVSTKPASTFTFSGKPCIDSLFTFSSSVPAGGANPPTWHWNFGDNQTGSSLVSNSITHTYATTAINRQVKHWVSYAAGCASDTAYQAIPLIRSNPVATFSVIGDTLCEKKPVTLESAVTGTNFWNWSLGSVVSNATPPFSHSFSSAGTYSIRLFLSNPDGCNSAPVSQSITINPLPAINAGPDKMINAGSSTTIDAVITNSSNYSFLWSPAFFLDNPSVLNPVSAPDRSITYTVLAMDKITNCAASDQVIISPFTGLYIPTAFTPNGDGKNDEWTIPGLAFYPKARVAVFNRQGQLLYETGDYSHHPWDGRFRGRLQPAGVYIYLVELKDDKQQIRKGTISLIR